MITQGFSIYPSLELLPRMTKICLPDTPIVADG